MEVLVRHLRPQLLGRIIKRVQVKRLRVIRPTAEASLIRALEGAKIIDVQRRAKFLLFSLRRPQDKPFELVGHLGMSGRMYLQPGQAGLPLHTAVVMRLDRGAFVYEDTRYFGRLTLDVSPLERLGVEPLSNQFNAKALALLLSKSSQFIKVKLLDQSLVAGLGNIYASEALFCAEINPAKKAKKLSLNETSRLVIAIKQILRAAIRKGGSIPLDFKSREGKPKGLFYFGTKPKNKARIHPGERFFVYDRAEQPCHVCRTPIRRTVQAARSTFHCPKCQP